MNQIKFDFAKKRWLANLLLASRCSDKFHPELTDLMVRDGWICGSSSYHLAAVRLEGFVENPETVEDGYYDFFFDGKGRKATSATLIKKEKQIPLPNFLKVIPSGSPKAKIAFGSHRSHSPMQSWIEFQYRLASEYNLRGLSGPLPLFIDYEEHIKPLLACGDDWDVEIHREWGPVVFRPSIEGKVKMVYVAVPYRGEYMETYKQELYEKYKEMYEEERQNG